MPGSGSRNHPWEAALSSCNFRDTLSIRSRVHSGSFLVCVTSYAFFELVFQHLLKEAARDLAQRPGVLFQRLLGLYSLREEVQRRRRRRRRRRDVASFNLILGHLHTCLYTQNPSKGIERYGPDGIRTHDPCGSDTPYAV